MEIEHARRLGAASMNRLSEWRSQNAKAALYGDYIATSILDVYPFQ